MDGIHKFLMLTFKYILSVQKPPQVLKINLTFHNKGKFKSFSFFAGKESAVYKDNSIHQKVLRTFYYHFLSAREQ